MIYTGQAFILGDSIDSEILHPASYFSLKEQVVKDGLFKGMPESVRKHFVEGSIIFAGKNFGCGSSREVIIQSLVLNGVKVIIAKSFSRIFYRNAINNGIVLVECNVPLSFVNMNDMVEVDLGKSIIRNITKNNSLNINFSSSILKIINKKGDY